MRESGDGGHDAAQVAADQRDVGGGHRHIGAGADGDAEIGLRQRRRVVDAVANHGHDPAAAPGARPDLSAFCSGSTSASTWSMPTWRAMASAVARLSPVSIHDVEPERLQLRDRRARLRLERVGDGDQPRRSAVDRDVHRRGARAASASRAARRARPARSRARPAGRGCPAATSRPSTRACDALAGDDAWKSVRARQR